MEGEPEEEPEAGEITTPKQGRVQPGAEMRIALQPKLEEVIRAPPLRLAESSDSSSGQREASKDRLRDSEAVSQSASHRVRRRHRREKAKSRSMLKPVDSEDDSQDNSDNVERKGRMKRRRKQTRLESDIDSASQSSSDGPGRHHRRNSKRRKRHSNVRKHRDGKSRLKGKAGHRSRHDWGTAKLKALEQYEPAWEQQRSAVSADDVPDALRARIKAMLAQSSAAS